MAGKDFFSFLDVLLRCVCVCVLFFLILLLAVVGRAKCDVFSCSDGEVYLLCSRFECFFSSLFSIFRCVATAWFSWGMSVCFNVDLVCCVGVE